ncbi:4Fe-4S dicluster domain-containing protein [Sulfuricurvum sp.]|uniref:4Fe-4S dicluster domain-containing protein n=1 Tax=Sulfuricurvum sp. TaxID=2025608 RepID=UPI003BB7CD48
MSKRQLAMVMDLNKCIGCQTCTVACKTQWTNRNGREYMYWNNVETYPGTGYPKNWMELGGGFDAAGDLQPGVIPNLEADYGVPWDYNYESLMGGQSDSNHFQPHVSPTWGPNWDEDEGAGAFPQDNYFFYLPRICNHCTNPGCLSACPRDAIFKREEDGVVLVDLDRCQGYRYCIAGCPYKKIYFNPKISKSEKCILCFPRIEQGLPPACAQQCVGRIRFVGFLDDEESQVHKLVHKYKVALGLRSDYGTQPNVYYIPPTESPAKFDAEGKIIEGSTRLPVEELEKLFGPAVHDAIKTLKAEMKKRKETGVSELMDLLIAYQHSDMFRLDNNYYQQVARDNKRNPLAPVDTRYIAGKFTTKGHTQTLFGGHNAGGHH